MQHVGVELAGLGPHIASAATGRRHGGAFGRATGPRFERRKGGLEKRAGAA